MKIYTIGFTQKNAEIFFGLIKVNNISKLIDVRLNNVSQLAGFAKKDDLKFFLKEICNCDYIHLPDLAPTTEILKPYKNKEITWEHYEEKFMNLMSSRRIEKYIDSKTLENSCLLCSEHQPHQCHRRLVIDYLNLSDNFDLNPTHLLKL